MLPSPQHTPTGKTIAQDEVCIYRWQQGDNGSYHFSRVPSDRFPFHGQRIFSGELFVDPESAVEAVPVILSILVIRSEEWTDFEPICERAICPTSADPSPVTHHPC